MVRFKLESAPGEVYRYANASYYALGLIIEAVTGRPYDEYCASAVLAPLGIRAAGLGPTWRILGAAGGWRLSGPEHLTFLKAFAREGPVLDDASRRWLERTVGRETSARREIFYTLGMNL